MAVASMNNIKTRMKSVQSTMQITKAMELVATSKLRRAKEKAESVRPFLKTLDGAVGAIAHCDAAKESKYFSAPASDRTLRIVIAGDRGLAGGYNANAFRLERAEGGENTLILPIGKKSVEHYRHTGAALYGEYEYVSLFEIGDSVSLAQKIVHDFPDGKFDRVELIYTRFASMLSQVPTKKQLLPVEAQEEQRFDPIFEGKPADILAGIIPSYVAGWIGAAVAESVASECGARRTAMNAANKNAGEMIDELQLHYNRARQAVITQEITEIVSGAEAL